MKLINSKYYEKMGLLFFWIGQESKAEDKQAMYYEYSQQDETDKTFKIHSSHFSPQISKK